MQIIFMIVNNLTYFIFWWLIFQKVEDINGYKLRDMAVIYGISAGAWGLSVVFAGGRRLIAQKIANGELDPILVQPKPILPHLMLSHYYPSGIGDLSSAFVLWGVTGYGLGVPFTMFLISIVLAAVIFTAAGIAAQSMAFWLGPITQIARQYDEFLITFSVNPQNVFGPFIKTSVFTVLPAGLITFLPNEAIRQSSWELLGLMLLGAGLLLFTSVVIFSRGLRLYSSGGGMVMRN